MSDLAAAFNKPLVPLAPRPAATAGKKRLRADSAAPAAPAAAAPAPAAAAASAPATAAQRAAGASTRPPRRPKRAAAAAAAARAAEDPARLARTLFVGNVPLDTARPALQRLIERALGAAAAAAAAGPAAPGAAAAAAAAPAPAGAAPGVGTVETVRLRSVPIAPLAVAPGAGYRAMIRAAVATGSRSGARASQNAYVVLREAALVPLACAALNGTVLGGLHLRVDAVGAPPARPGAAPGGSGGGGGAGLGGATRYDPKRTVFVGNLPYSATEEALRSAMGGEGAGVEAVRLVRDRATQAGKGIGYVLFRERAAVLGALALHGVACAQMGGRALRVERCEAGAGAAAAAAAAGGAGGARGGSSGGGGGAPAGSSSSSSSSGAAGAPPAPKRPRHTHGKAAQPSHMGVRGEEAVAAPRAALPQRKALVAGSHGVGGRGRGPGGKKLRAAGGRNGVAGGRRGRAAAAPGLC